jgi:hypothetical protein
MTKLTLLHVDDCVPEKSLVESLPPSLGISEIGAHTLGFGPFLQLFSVLPHQLCQFGVGKRIHDVKRGIVSTDRSRAAYLLRCYIYASKKCSRPCHYVASGVPLYICSQLMGCCSVSISKSVQEFSRLPYCKPTQSQSPLLPAGGR